MKGLPPALRKALNNTAQKAHKYGAVRSTCLYRHDHASRKEADWCVKLHELQKEGKITHLKAQESFDLIVGKQLICRHIVDFYYFYVASQSFEIVEVKGMPTPEWKLKHKLFCALYPLINYQVV